MWSSWRLPHLMSMLVMVGLKRATQQCYLHSLPILSPDAGNWCLWLCRQSFLGWKKMFSIQKDINTWFETVNCLVTSCIEWANRSHLSFDIHSCETQHRDWKSRFSVVTWSSLEHSDEWIFHTLICCCLSLEKYRNVHLSIFVSLQQNLLRTLQRLMVFQLMVHVIAISVMKYKPLKFTTVILGCNQS